MAKGETIEVSAAITNTGTRRGSETVGSSMCAIRWAT